MTHDFIRREQKKLGKCDDGKQYVNPSFVNMLVNMGYNREQARVALQKCNNVISSSVEYIQEHPGPSGTKSEELLGWINDLIPEVGVTTLQNLTFLEVCMFVFQKSEFDF